MKFSRKYFNRSTPKLIHDISDAIALACTTALGYSILLEHKTIGIITVVILSLSLSVKRFFNDD